MDAKAASEILMAAKPKQVDSLADFNKKRKDKRFIDAKGRKAVDAFMTHYCVKDRASRLRFERWLKNADEICDVDTPKRQRMDISYEEDPNPLDVTMESVSNDDVNKDDVIEELTAEVAAKDKRIAELELELMKNVESNVLFGKGSRNNCFKPEMEIVALKSLSRGVNSKQLNYVLTQVADTFGFKEEDVPTKSTLCRWRDSKLRPLVEEQINQFVRNAESLVLHLDDTSMPGSSKTSCLLLTNQLQEQMLMDLVPSDAKTGEDLKNQILKRLYKKSEAAVIINKLRALMSDLGSQQLKANRLVCEQLEASPHRQGLPKIVNLICGMHTCLNCDGRINRYMKSEAKTAHELHQKFKLVLQNRKVLGILCRTVTMNGNC